MPKTARASELAPGAKTPDFTLPDHSGKDVKLSSFRGKKNVVLVFYPGDMTPGCAMQLCAIRDDWRRFDASGTAVFGINHGDAQSHAAFVKKYAFPFPLLVDKDKKVSRRYGATKKFFNARIIRRTVVGVDRNGKIAYVKRGMPKTTEILKAFAKGT